MSRIVILAVALAMYSANVANAGNRIELFADQSATSCNLEDHSVARLTVFVFLMGDQPATAVRFQAPKPACWAGATWVEDHTPDANVYPAIGNSQEDWMISFDNGSGLAACLNPPLLIGSIDYDAAGESSPCCALVPLAPLGRDELFLYIDCNFVDQPLSAGHGVVINPNVSCQCGIVGVESSTWGQVKALYR